MTSSRSTRNDIEPIQLPAPGTIGEYIAKIFIETIGRPYYFIEGVVGGQVDITNPSGSTHEGDCTQATKITMPSDLSVAM
jgi:hypothetical protein